MKTIEFINTENTPQSVIDMAKRKAIGQSKIQVGTYTDAKGKHIHNFELVKSDANSLTYTCLA